MRRQTRDLVRLVTEDVTAAVLDSISNAPKTRDEIEAELGAKKSAIDKSLLRLKDRGLATFDLVLTGAKGRPAERWKPRARDAIAAFDRAATAFDREVLAQQLAELDDE